MGAYTMRKLMTAVIIVMAAALVLPALIAVPSSSQKHASAAQEVCPPPEELAALQADLDALLLETEAIRAYKDATITQLARTNETLYSFRSELERGETSREDLLEERNTLMSDGLSEADIERLNEIDDELIQLAVLINGANEREEEQLDVVGILWRPVIDLSEVEAVSVERYERYTQRILEVRLGAAVGDIEQLATLLDQYSACLTIAPQPSGIGVSGGQ